MTDKRFSITIDTPPIEGVYVQVRDAQDRVIANLLPPTTGKLELHFSDGIYRGGMVAPAMEKV